MASPAPCKTKTVCVSDKSVRKRFSSYILKAYRRNDSATVEVDRFEYGRLTLEGSNVTFDALTSARQDLSFHTLEHKCVEHLGISELTPDIMRTLRLLGKDGYTNAAAILADKNDFPGIDCVRFGDTEDVILGSRGGDKYIRN